MRSSRTAGFFAAAIMTLGMGGLAACTDEDGDGARLDEEIGEIDESIEDGVDQVEEELNEAEEELDDAGDQVEEEVEEGEEEIED